jgi:hypothetical protein
MCYNIVESYLTNFISTLQDKGQKQFLLNISFRGSYYTDGENYQVNPRDVFVLVDARTTYIGIWIYEQELWTKKPIKNLCELKSEDFVFQSRHDSCWRSDGMSWIFKNYIGVRDQLVELLKSKNVKVKSIHDINKDVCISPGLSFYHDVSFEINNTQEFRPGVTNFKIVNK